MPEAVIVDAIRTPIGRAVKGSLKDVRADDLAAVPLKALVERNPEVDFARDRRHHDGLRLRRWASRATTSAATPACSRASTTTSRPRRSTASAPPRCRRMRMAFHADQGRRGRPVHRRRRRGRLARAARGHDFEFHPKLDGSEGSLYNVYIPMGLTAENVAERCNVSARRRTSGRSCRRTAPSTPSESGHFDKEIVPVETPAATETDKEGNEVQVEAGRSPRTTARAPARRWRSSPSSSPAFKRGRHRDGRQRVPAQRRRRRRARDVRGEGQGARPEAEGAHRRLGRRRDPARDHGPRPAPGGPEACSSRRA